MKFLSKALSLFSSTTLTALAFGSVIALSPLASGPIQTAQAEPNSDLEQARKDIEKARMDIERA